MPTPCPTPEAPRKIYTRACTVLRERLIAVFQVPPGVYSRGLSEGGGGRLFQHPVHGRPLRAALQAVRQVTHSSQGPGAYVALPASRVVLRSGDWSLLG